MRAITAGWLDDVFLGRRELRILDAGCGAGANGEFLERYGRTVGIDVSAHATQLATRRMPQRVGRASVVALPFRDQSFDLVTSFEVLYHRAVGDVGGALAEVQRVLKPGGHVLLRLPAYQWLLSQHDQSVHARERYTRSKVHALLAQAHFEVVHLSYCNGILFPVAAAQRLLERVRPPTDHQSALLPQAPLVNTALRTALDAEAIWFARGGTLPWGLSVMALAQAKDT